MIHIIFASLIVAIETFAHSLGLHLGLESLLACQCHFVQQDFHSQPIKQALYNKMIKINTFKKSF